jgi:hypothetical protein
MMPSVVILHPLQLPARPERGVEWQLGPAATMALRRQLARAGSLAGPFIGAHDGRLQC